MSVLRPRPPEEPLEVAEAVTGIDAVAGWAAPVAAALSAVLAAADDPAAQALLGVDALLADYGITRSTTTRRGSRLFALLGAARDLAAVVDRVVVLGPSADLAGMRLVLAACAHPWHDQLGRGERGGRPRLLFLAADPVPDPDALAGLADLLAGPAMAVDGQRDLLDRAALVVIGAPHQGLHDTVALLGPLVDHRVTWVTDLESGGPAAGPATPVAPAGLLAGALAGIDVVRLLVGAAALVARCRDSTATDPVAALVQALAGPSSSRSVEVDTAALAPLEAWYGHLLHGAGLPGTLVTGPGGARAAARAAVRVVVRGGKPRRDPTAVASVAETVATAVPGAVVRLPRVDEHSLGQLVALLILATAVERRLAAGDRPAGARCGAAVGRL